MVETNGGKSTQVPSPLPPDPFCVLHFFGILFLVITLPPVACVVGTCTLWYYMDPIIGRVAPKVVDFIGSYLGFIVRKKEDHFLVATLLLQAVCVPLFCLYCFHQYTLHGFSASLAFLYHLVRIGPFFTNFAYAYTLCHKEGHTSRIGFFNSPYNYCLSHVWNWWIGIFYGVLPSTFAYGHSLNHHKWNNDEMDVITTWDRSRDSFWNYLRYLPRWVMYHSNISSIYTFYQEGNTNVVIKMIAGTVYYALVFGVILRASPLFALVYFAYPLGESILLLSCINWSWHCFLDPDINNVYASSITILEGESNTNILNEDYHVVHHQYPGAHWTQHPILYAKHKQDYIDKKATIFLKTHAMEIFFFAILQKYDLFADKWVDLSGTMTRQDKEDLIKTRLRTVSWGAHKNTIAVNTTHNTKLD